MTSPDHEREQIDAGDKPMHLPNGFTEAPDPAKWMDEQLQELEAVQRKATAKIKKQREGSRDA